MKRGLTILFLMLAAAAFTALYAASAVKSGDTVFAEWVKNGWYHGTVGDRCNGTGYMINFDDGDVKCCTPDKIVRDTVPAKTDVLPGKRVLAQWSDGRYYPGKVSVISDGKFNIDFDDGDKGTVDLAQVRLFD